MKDSLASAGLLLVALAVADGGKHMPVQSIGEAIRGVVPRAMFPSAGRVAPQQQTPVQPATQQRRR